MIYEKKRRQRIKFGIIIAIGILAILSAMISLGDIRSTSRESITVVFTTEILNRDYRSTLEENYLVAGRESRLTFKLVDNRTGEAHPISGLEPGTYFYLLEKGDGGSEHDHSGGGLSNLEGISMAKIQLFVLNSRRGTIEVLDTFGDYSTSPGLIKNMVENMAGKRMTMTSKVIVLKDTPGHNASDMVTGRYGENVYVTLPDEDQVAVVNTITHEITKYIDVGPSPGRLFQQPKSKYLWVSNEASDSVSVIDTANNTLAKTLKTGRGYHQVAFSGENAYVTNSYQDTVSVIRLKDLTNIRDIKVGKGPYGIDYTEATGEVYVTSTLSGIVTVIDSQENRARKYFPLSKGIVTVRFSPDQRNRGVILDMYNDIAYVIDANTRSVLKKVKTGKGPNTVDFMDNFAVIRNTFSPDITYINMIDPGIRNTLGIGGGAPLSLSPHSVVTASYGTETVVTSPIDGRVFFLHWMKGRPMIMNSAMVSFGSDTAAFIENKLHETAPGTYQQYIVLDRPGTYSIKFRSQKINATFDLKVLPDEITGPVAIASFKNRTFIPGTPAVLQYHIINGRTEKPEDDIADISYLVFMRPTVKRAIWTQRVPPKNMGNGTYEAEVTFPGEGDYMVTLDSKTLRERGYETAYDYIRVRNSTGQH